MITLSPKAAGKTKHILQEENKQDWKLRVGVKGGGCSGLSYEMKFEEIVSEHDHLFQFDDINIIVDAKSLAYLAGTNIDYKDGLNSSGFVFLNPNAARSCGCGNSFSA